MSHSNSRGVRVTDDEVPMLESCQHLPIIEEIEYTWNVDSSGVALEAPCQFCGLFVEFYIEINDVDWNPVIEIRRKD